MIDPSIVVLLGSVACLAILNDHVAIRDRHGEMIERDGQTGLGIAERGDTLAGA